jgi:hypothetical protein
MHAVAWARKVEAEMDARHFNDIRGLANITRKELVGWSFHEIGAQSKNFTVNPATGSHLHNGNHQFIISN